MGYWTITVLKQVPLPAGEKYIRGTADGYSSYSTGGDTFDLSAYLDASTTPTILASNIDGYVLAHDGGTASAGKLKVLDSYGSEVSSTTDLSDCSIVFTAFGDGK